MSIRVETVTLPAFLASALVNGDMSGLESDDDRATLARALAYLGEWRVVDVACDDEGRAQEPRFTWYMEIYDVDEWRAGEALDYICHVSN